VPAVATTAGGQIPTAVPEPCTPYDAATWTSEYVANLIGVHIQGSDIPAALTKPFCSGVITSPKANTDVLVVRHAESCTAGSGSAECSNTMAAAFPDVYFQASRCGTDTETFVLGTGGLVLHNRDCETGTPTVAPIRRFSSTLYYVKDDGTNPPTLMRSTFGASGAPATHQPAQALVENVESFRIEFGIDNKSDAAETVTFTAEVDWVDAKNKTSPRNRGDGIPDGAYVRCTQAAPCSALDMANTVSAKIYILVRAERKTANYQDTKTYKMGSVDAGPYNDGYKRHLFSQTVRLVNVSGRRETP
jgi:type IV pilus assembly protein PilW